MEPDDRIRRMEEDDILTPDQAAMLRESLAAGAAEQPQTDGPGGRRWRLAWVVGGLAGLAGLAMVAVLVLAPGADVEQAAIQDVANTLNQAGGHAEMNKPLSAVLAIAILIIVPLLLWAWMHNSLVSKEERVFEAWAQTESNFQRRADLIPALIETVSRYMKHERETLTAVTRERGVAAAALSRAVDDVIRAEKGTSDLLRGGGRKVVEEEGAMAALFEAHSKVGRSMTTLLGVAEAYPDLRASDQFLQLQAQLEGTENRINVARMRFNDAVRDYNGATRRLPSSLVAQVGNFRRKAYFQSEKEAHNAPAVQFK